MIIRIFKFLSLCILSGVLFFVIENRDISISSSKKFFTQQHYSSNAKIAPEKVTATKEIEEVLPVEVRTVTPPVEKVAAATTTPVETKQTPLAKVTAVYETLNEEPSDTDPSYKPTVSPCTSPMGYKIGTFDSRFGISKAQFIQEIAQSTSLWAEAANKKLFFYDENGPLTINLIYDKRQATTVDANYLRLEIENSKRNAEGIRDTYEQEKVTYTKESNQLTQDIESFQLRNKAYGDKVATYNAAGGAQRVEYDAMMLELTQLKQEAKNLDDHKQSLLALAESINKKVVRYNEFVVYTNNLIKQSNALGAAKFTEGRFTPYTNTIDIYQYNDSIKLRRVMTHELGHVLGIDHNKNTQSIMYSFNSATTTSLSKEDIRDLRTVCSLE